MANRWTFPLPKSLQHAAKSNRPDNPPVLESRREPFWGEEGRVGLRTQKIGTIVNVLSNDDLPGTVQRKLEHADRRCRLGGAQFARCDVAYFDRFERFVAVNELRSTVYPKDPAAPICACFGFTLEDIEADVRQGTPTRIRELLAKSKSSDAQCRTLAADGRCCLREVRSVARTTPQRRSAE